MTPPSLRAMTSPWLMPAAAAVLAAVIFVVDTVTDLEIAAPAFYTAVVLLSVRFCSQRGVVLVGVGCIVLTLASDLLTSPGASPELGFINTVINLLAIATTTYLSVKIEAERAASYEARVQLAHRGRTAPTATAISRRANPIAPAATIRPAAPIR